jgi:hypothetical protein
MMRDEYCWTDHVISPRRLRAEFIATLLIVAIVGGACFVDTGVADGRPGQDHRSYATDDAVSAGHAPSLAAIARGRASRRNASRTADKAVRHPMSRGTHECNAVTLPI